MPPFPLIPKQLRRTTTILLGLVTLTTGGVLYLLYRTRSLLVLHLADKIGLGSTIDQLRAQAPTLHVPEWVIYSLPGGLWAAAYILIMDAVARQLSLGKRLLLASVIPLSGITSELLQWPGLLPGTFDIIDILCYGLPLAIYSTKLNISNDIQWISR